MATSDIYTAISKNKWISLSSLYYKAGTCTLNIRSIIKIICMKAIMSISKKEGKQNWNKNILENVQKQQEVNKQKGYQAFM